MEAAVIRILLPCKHGCGENITYYGKEGHEKACKAGPCFCPDPGCCFRGQTTALFDHFTTHHKWPANNFIDYLWQTCFAPEVYPPNPSQGTRRLDVPAVPGIRVLRSDEGHLFLLNVASLESHALKRHAYLCITWKPVAACRSLRAHFPRPPPRLRLRFLKLRLSLRISEAGGAPQFPASCEFRWQPAPVLHLEDPVTSTPSPLFTCRPSCRRRVAIAARRSFLRQDTDPARRNIAVEGRPAVAPSCVVQWKKGKSRLDYSEKSKTPSVLRRPCS
ncbi:hypothetical protein ACQ4PT_071074 [Festuca glaucescens]